MNIKSKMSGLFNWQYFCQNIKKSKGLIIIMTMLLIGMNVVWLNKYATSSTVVEIYTLERMSHVNVVGLYVYPIVLSMVLFGFMFDKKEVDFTYSLPISRKSIFTTNTIGGILVITCCMFINTIISAIVIQYASLGKVFFSLLVDGFVAWTIYYVLFFVLANFVFSIVGTRISGIVTIITIIFFIPAMLYANPLNHKALNVNKGKVIGSKFCWRVCENKEISPINIFMSKIYSYDDYRVFSTKYLIISAISIIIYMIIGFYFFNKRKTEKCGNSFSNVHIHYIMRTLITMPFVIFIICDYKYTSVISLILGSVIVGFCLIYDYIGIKSLGKKRLSIVYGILTIIISIGCYKYVFPRIGAVEKVINKEFALEDVDAIGLKCEETQNTFYYKNKEFIDLLLSKKSLMRMDIDNEEITDDLMGISLTLVVDGIKIRDYGICITKEEHDELLKFIDENKIYNELYNNITKNVKAINIRNQSLKNISAKEFMNGLENSKIKFSVIPSEFRNNINKKYGVKKPTDKIMRTTSASCDFSYFYKDIELCQYNNHKIKIVKIKPTASKYVRKFCADMSNKDVKEGFINKSIDIWDMELESENIVLKEEDSNILDVLSGYKPEEFINFVVENIDENIDVEKDLLSISMYVDIDEDIVEDKSFVTTKKQEFVKLVERLYNELESSEKEKDRLYNEIGYNKIEKEQFNDFVARLKE